MLLYLLHLGFYRLQEFWLTSDNQAVSREQFLVVLQRIEAVYVLAAQNSNVRSLRCV